MIRKVLLSDAETIAAIYNHYVTTTTVSFEVEPLSVEEMRQRISAVAAAFPYYVYEHEGRVVGFCYAHKWKERAAYDKTLETTIYLSPDCLHRGIGQQLMETLISDCRERGARVLIACITYGNVSSIRFHERLGFGQVSHFHQVGFKFGRSLDVVDYQLVLCEEDS